MVKTLKIICAICAICGQTHAEYIIAIKNGTGLNIIAQAPPGTRVVDYTSWRDVPPDAKQYNPAYYPSVIDTETGMQAQQPGTWTNALATLSRQVYADLTEDQLTDIAQCRQELGLILYQFGISMPVRPKAAIDSMIESAATLEELKAANKALALYTRLRVEYNFTDAEIGGAE